MNARSRRQLAVALAVLALLVAAVGTWAARHGRGVSTGPSRPAANPDAGATTSLGTVPVQGPAPPQAAAAPAGPVRVSPGPGTVKVSWDRFPGSVRLYSVGATDQTAGYSGTVFACGSCTETTFQQLINGHQYTFAVAAYLGARPGAPRRSPVATPTSPLCPSGPCLAVDTGLALGPTTQRGQGFLHSISEATDPARAKALQIRSWRGAGGAQQAAIVRRYTGDTIQVVSDYWAQAMYDQARQGVKPPWEDWGAFEH